MDLQRILLGEDWRWELSERLFGYILGGGFCVGKICLCKLFRKSEVIWRGSISEMRISSGFGLEFGDWDLVLWKGLWISWEGVGFYFGMGCGKVIGHLWCRFGLKCDNF